MSMDSVDLTVDDEPVPTAAQPIVAPTPAALTVTNHLASASALPAVEVFDLTAEDNSGTTTPQQVQQPPPTQTQPLFPATPVPVPSSTQSILDQLGQIFPASDPMFHSLAPPTQTAVAPSPTAAADAEFQRYQHQQQMLLRIQSSQQLRQQLERLKYEEQQRKLQNLDGSRFGIHPAMGMYNPRQIAPLDQTPRPLVVPKVSPDDVIVVDDLSSKPAPTPTRITLFEFVHKLFLTTGAVCPYGTQVVLAVEVNRKNPQQCATFVYSAERQKIGYMDSLFTTRFKESFNSGVRMTATILRGNYPEGSKERIAQFKVYGPPHLYNLTYLVITNMGLKPLTKRDLTIPLVNGAGGSLTGYNGLPPVNGNLLRVTSLQDLSRMQSLSQGAVVQNGSATSLVDAMLNTARDFSKMPLGKQPDRLKTKLLPYQLQGLAWMMEREHPTPPSLQVPQFFWIVNLSMHGEITYSNTLTKDEPLLVPPTLPRGGILADDMGLGKTIQFISLIASDPDGDPTVVKHGIKRDPQISKCTLVVCPLSVVSTWVDQFQAHVQRTPPLSVCVYHGNNRVQTKEELMKFDVVITTYNVLSCEYALTQDQEKARSSKRQNNGLLHVIRWLRVILDEGHAIKSRQTKQSQAACALDAERRWVSTGTPIQNRLDDLYSLLKFIQADPLSDRDVFSTMISRPINSGYLRREATVRLQSALQYLCLRRLKSMEIGGKKIIELPEKLSHIKWLKMQPEEMELYENLKSRSKDIIEGYVQRGILLKNYAHVLEQLMRLRQLCDHSLLAMKEGSVLNELEAVSRARALLLESESEECSICNGIIKHPLITPCGHFYCTDCITRSLEQTKICPLCDAALEQAQLVPLHANQRKSGKMKDEDEDEDDFPLVENPWTMATSCPKSRTCPDFKLSSKMVFLLDLLAASKVADPTTKTVVFSQWTTMLNLLERLLRDNNIKFVRLDGAMRREKREENLSAFRTKPDVVVFLVSLRCGGLGLNLTCAQQVVLMDPWFNPSVEDQAVDRVYRLGQTKPVKVWRLFMEDTIEDTIFSMQEKKRQLMKDALNDPDSSKSIDTRADKRADLDMLLGRGLGLSIAGRLADPKAPGKPRTGRSGDATKPPPVARVSTTTSSLSNSTVPTDASSSAPGPLVPTSAADSVVGSAAPAPNGNASPLCHESSNASVTRQLSHSMRKTSISSAPLTHSASTPQVFVLSDEEDFALDRKPISCEHSALVTTAAAPPSPPPPPRPVQVPVDVDVVMEDVAPLLFNPMGKTEPEHLKPVGFIQTPDLEVGDFSSAVVVCTKRAMDEDAKPNENDSDTMCAPKRYCDKLCPQSKQ